MSPGKAQQGQTEKKIDGPVQEAEKNQAGVDRRLGHIKSRKQRRPGDKPGQKIKHQSGLENGQGGHFEQMMFFIMPDFMSDDGHDLGRRMPLDQGIEQNQPFSGAQAGEKGVGPGAAPGAVHDKDLVEGKSVLPRISQDRIFKMAVGQGGKAVEQRHNPGRHNHLHGQHEGRDRQPAPKPGPVPGIRKEGQYPGQQGRAQDQGQGQHF